MPSETDARIWLRANGYATIADEIDRIMAMWRERGLKTRRNWWEALAGTRKGVPMMVEGFSFPIIAAVRLRRGLPSVDGAIELPPGVTVPEQVPQVRWATKAPPMRQTASVKQPTTPSRSKPKAKVSASPKSKKPTSPRR